MKVLTKDEKLTEKIGRKHRTDHSSPARPTNALTVQAITELGTTRQQPHTPPISSPANGTGIHKNSSQPQNNSPQQHSQQSASTMSISTPTLMVNNPLQSGPQHSQQQHPPPQLLPPNQAANSPIRHNQFNQQFQQSPMLQVSPLMAPPQQYNPQIPQPYFHHYPPTNSPSVDSK